MSETVIRTEFDEGPKTFEHALHAAFKAGIALGTGYESIQAIPADWRILRWRAFRDAWAGSPWDAQKWSDEREAMWARRDEDRRRVGGFFNEH